MTLQKPGEHPYYPGEYLEVDRFGIAVINARRVTMEPGDTPLPPTSNPGNYWLRIW